MKSEGSLLHSLAGDAADWAWPLAWAERACCCPARPVVTAVMPPVTRRPYAVDLLLCGHHFRASELSLLASGATVYDAAGIVMPAGNEPSLIRVS